MTGVWRSFIPHLGMHKEVKNDKKKNIGKTLRASLMDNVPNPLLFFPFLFSTKSGLETLQFN